MRAGTGLKAPPRPQEFYKFENFFNMPLTDKDIEAKPFVLLIGQYSVGKTSFINHLLGETRSTDADA